MDLKLLSIVLITLVLLTQACTYRFPSATLPSEETVSSPDPVPTVRPSPSTPDNTPEPADTRPAPLLKPPPPAVLARPHPSPTAPAPPPLSRNASDKVERTCQRIARKLASVSLMECLTAGLRPSRHHSVNGIPILVTEFPALRSREPLGRVLLIGGTHGDELTSISPVFKWVHKLQKHHSGMFHWRVAPVVNPDGALLKRSVRMNANGVDLNRNLPTPNWTRLSREYWLVRTKRNPRRYPGQHPASEPETVWLVEEIDRFKPDIIVSLHAPHGIVDYDSHDRRAAPHRIGILHRDFLGTFPGSLGNYAGVHMGIPVVTLEMPHAYVMPTPQQINQIWIDLVYWLQQNVPKVKRARQRLNGDRLSSLY